MVVIWKPVRLSVDGVMLRSNKPREKYGSLEALQLPVQSGITFLQAYFCTLLWSTYQSLCHAIRLPVNKSMN